jgi:hypothetical protein
LNRRLLWAPELIWTFWDDENLVIVTGIGTAIHRLALYNELFTFVMKCEHVKEWCEL